MLTTRAFCEAVSVGLEKLGDKTGAFASIMWLSQLSSVVVLVPLKVALGVSSAVPGVH
jgi:hypothetical protein